MQEAVQLRAVVERQRVDLHVVGAHLAVDDAGDVLRDQAAAASAWRPWAATRSRWCRSAASGSSSADRRRPAQWSSPCAIQRVDRLPALGRRRRLVGITARTRIARRAAGLRERRLGDRKQRVLDDQPDRAGVLEHVGHLVGAEHEVDRHGRSRRAGPAPGRPRRTRTSCASAAPRGRPRRPRGRPARWPSG